MEIKKSVRRIVAELKGIQPHYLKETGAVVASVFREAERGAPFRKGPRQALDEVLAIAQ